MAMPASSDKSARQIKKVMDNLYHFSNPKSPPSSSSVGKSRRAELGTRFGMEKGLRVPQDRHGAPPPCRPWDRSDLIRRLTTFKAMTWFAKPKVISPVNCARRGWVNIEVDTISCEACGARLLFTTPSSWTSEQVDKAALVFSLKLDNGHKLLCPWMDNICEESLINFPPTLPAILANNYNENVSSLLKLSSLPAISSSAIQYMKSRAPELEELLKEKSLEIGINRGIRVSEELQLSDFEGLVEDSNLYYQALNLISLCGWAPHQLPYAVNRVKENTSESSEQGIPTTLSIYESTGESSDSNPLSFVLQCGFCGARAALWTFKTIRRPLRLFKLVSNDNGVANDDNNNNRSDNGNVGGLNANSIGGGPSATKQNFKPRVWFPVVSRHLKSDLQSFGGLKRKRSSDDILNDCSKEPSVEKQNNYGFAEISSGKKLLVDGNDEFDPIKQHRMFCPWISPEDKSDILPGWKLTFLALLSQEKEKDNDPEAPLEERHSSFLDEEEEDPVVSVRRLFMQSPSKRLKLKDTP